MPAARAARSITPLSDTTTKECERDYILAARAPVFRMRNSRRSNQTSEPTTNIWPAPARGLSDKLVTEDRIGQPGRGSLGDPAQH